MSERAVESSAEIVLDLNEKKPIMVLHVDDELGLLKVAKQCLEMQGPFQVDTASSVEEALEKLKKESYDAVISDYLMPGKNGLEFLKELREKGNTTPFIIFTGKGREEVAIRALNLGANQYLSKVGEPETVYTELAHSITELAKARKAEQELRDSEERFRNLFEKANDGLVFVDLSGRIVDINQKLVHMAERTKEDIVGKSFLELGLVSSKDVPVLVGRLRQNAMGKSTGSFKFEIGKENSEKKSIEINSVLIRKENVPLGSLVIVRDITERKKKEEALRESEEKYKDLFESAMDVILTLDLKGSVTAVNSSILRFGYKKEDLVGKNILDFISKEYWPTTMRDFSQVTQGEPAKNETEIVVPTGKMLVEYHARAIVKESNVTGVQINLRDVTERKKVEGAVRNSEAKLRAILASSPEAISVSDLSAKLIDCNEAFLKLHGYLSKEELIGTSWFDIIAPANRSKMQDTMGKLLEHGYIKNMEFALLKKGSQEFIGELSASLVLDSSGKPTSIVVVARDITERKEMEEKLRESEGRFRDLFESIQDPVGIFVGREGRLIDYNTAFKKSSGYTDEELKGKAFLDFVHPDDHAMVLEKYQTKYSEEELPLLYEIRGMNKKGESIPLELSVSTYKRKGRVIGIEVIHRDITERKKAEELVRASEERYRSNIEVTGQLGWTTNANGEVEEDIPAWRKFTGQSHEEVKGWGWTKALHPDDLEHTTQVWEKAVATKSTYEVEYRIRKYDGVYRYFLAHGVPVFNEDGSIREWVGTCIDITERKQTEEALRRSEEQARRLLELQNKIIDTAIVWIDLLDREGNVTLWNRAAELISGYTREEVIGHKKIWEWLYPNPQYSAGIFARAKRIIDKKLEQNFETEIRCKDGTPKTISWYTNSITDGKGKPVGSIAIGLDVSQLKKTEGELREAMEKLRLMNEKLRVVGGLTRHDVRNKLTSVTGNAYLARKKLPGNSEVLDHMKQIEASVEQTVKILDFAKTYAMLGVEELVYIDVEKTVNEAISLFPPLKDINVINDCHALTLLADSLLKQLFYNLIGNSLKYAEKLSRIRVYYEEKNSGHLKVIYEDDGVGIPDTEKPKLFKEGYSTGGSTGYGLYLIKKIMEVYGWTIQETGEPGKGAQFVMTIPKTNKDGKENYQLC